jgi:membrane protease YdiL (CAAX protease family)
LGEALFWLVFYSFLLALLMRPLSRSGSSLRVLIGSRPDPAATRWAVAAGVALLGISLASFYAVFLPLSYAAPGLIESWFIENQSPLIWMRGGLHPLANIVNLFVLALFGPFVEELFFRGLLLPAWSVRFGPRWAVIWSSLVFAVLHVDLVGVFVFGVVTALAFLKTRTLWLPIVIHVTHNGLVWALAAGDLVFHGGSAGTVADFQASWWLGVTGLVVGVPLLIRVLRRMDVLRASGTP